MRRAILAIAAFSLASPLAAQDGLIQQRTVEDAQRFFSKLASQGAVLEFIIGNSTGQVDLTGASAGSPCVTTVSLNPASVRWSGSPPRQRIDIPATVDIDWGRHGRAESASKSRITKGGQYAGALWGLRVQQDWTPIYASYLLFDQPSSFATRMVEAAEFLREKCQLQSDTGF